MKLIFTLTTFLWLCTNFVHAQYNLSLSGQITYPDSIQMSGCWGYTAADGSEYALVGTSYGTSIVDVTNPFEPEELFFVGGAQSAWREVKTWNNHAYVTTEGGGGLMIIDLNNLPDAIDTISFVGTDDHPFSRAHTLFIDENGIAYLFGYNVLTGADEGAYIVDLNLDPMHPIFLSEINSVYIHDGYVRGDTLWAAAVYEGALHVFDVSDKTTPILIGVQPTSGSATHNCWLSDDGKYLFTTDEIQFGFISSFDVTDITDIKQLDQIKHGAPDSTVAHNTYFLNNYLVTAHYTEGCTIHDATRPDNLIEVAHFDTSPFGPDAILEGAWGVYPYFTSGTIIISDISEGLIVLQPVYNRACYLEGTVKDVVSLTNIINANVELVGTTVLDSTSINGAFKTGYHEAGNYTVTISKEGCITQNISDVNLISGEVTSLNVLLDCGSTPISNQVKTGILNCYYSAPTHSIIIDFDIPTAALTAVELTNFEGQIISTFTISGSGNSKIDVSNLPRGAYFVNFKNGNNKFAKQLIVH